LSTSSMYSWGNLCHIPTLFETWIKATVSVDRKCGYFTDVCVIFVFPLISCGPCHLSPCGPCHLSTSRQIVFIWCILCQSLHLLAFTLALWHPFLHSPYIHLNFALTFYTTIIIFLNCYINPSFILSTCPA